MSASLAYRRNEAAILAGNPPEKYTRLLPHIPGRRVLEIGSAEGVLACMLARRGDEVIAVERNAERHRAATVLAQYWNTPGIRFINGSIADNLDLLDGVDTVVAVRSIYYLGDALDSIFAAIAARVPNVVLCGNANRARRYHAGTPDEPLGEMNYYASAKGMRDLLLRHGYEIVSEVLDGDAIIIGQIA